MLFEEEISLTSSILLFSRSKRRLLNLRGDRHRGARVVHTQDEIQQSRHLRRPE
jgi:hypothetical protein